MSDPLRVVEKSFFADWLAAFPLLKRHKGGRRLLRIYDPVVFGIELWKINAWGGPQYRPEFVAQSLLTHGSGFGISREAYDRRHLQLFIDYDEHSAKFDEAAHALRARFPLLTATEVGEQDMIDLYRGELHSRMEGVPGSVEAAWEALLQILKYYGRADEHDAERRAMLAYVQAPPSPLTIITREYRPSKERRTDYELARESVKEYVTPRYHPCKSYAEYEEKFAAEIDPPLEVLLARRAERIAKGRWDRLPGVGCAGAGSAHEACG